MSDEIDSEAVSLIFEHVHNAPEQQLGDADALDSKMVQLFSAGSVIIGLAGLSTAKGTGGALSGLLLAAAVIAYVFVAVTAFQHLGVREFYRSLQADQLWRHGWNRSPDEIKQALIDDIGRAYAHNKPILVEKGESIKSAVRALGFEVVFVGAALVATRLF